ncbi:hypothetical protein GCM10010271_43420 [Streptomyces kurssanovii]|nr:hypothetical protein GCM10010271_43420 [Streptomyces kurssanovii]
MTESVGFSASRYNRMGGGPFRVEDVGTAAWAEVGDGAGTDRPSSSARQPKLGHPKLSTSVRLMEIDPLDRRGGSPTKVRLTFCL